MLNFLPNLKFRTELSYLVSSKPKSQRHQDFPKPQFCLKEMGGLQYQMTAPL